MLASNVIFPQQVFQCHLKSLYFKLYLSITHMFYSILFHKNWIKPLLDNCLSYGIASRLAFLLIILSCNTSSIHSITCIIT